MKNFSKNGSVAPHGLLSSSLSDLHRGTSKTYGNYSLRFGVIKKIYDINDPLNVSKLTTEYDVDVIEQDGNRGIAPITYKNCLTVDALGSIADYFEKNFRVQTQTANQALPITKGQNGATVLVLCMDATMGKGVIVGGLNHPDRPTNLTTAEPQLYGEYNGVNVAVNPDGSTALTFKGATDSYGVPTDPSQGNTIVAIATDGSFSVTNTATTFNMSKSGDITVTATGMMTINTTKDTVVNAQGNSTIKATGNVDITAGGDVDITAGGNVVVKGTQIELNGTASGITTFNSHMGVIDLITGVPVMPSTTTLGDI